MDISKIDKNFQNNYSFEGMKTYDVNQPPFRLYGLCREVGETDFKRLPHALVDKYKFFGITRLYTNTSGIRVRFRTDSTRITLSAVLPLLYPMSHMPLTGSMGFDLYADGEFCNVLRPDPAILGNGAVSWGEPCDFSSGYTFKEKRERDILIHFPLYNDVSEVYISLEEDATLLPPSKEYRTEKPIVYYGSSITQGGCASHPGNSYCAVVSRRLDADFINLGFSGSCRGQIELAEYMTRLDMSVFVLDYDHNSDTADTLQQTYEPFFKKIREHNPDLPVIMISAADLAHKDRERRKEIIRTTWENARAAGDENVYFIDGDTIYEGIDRHECTVDSVHPNDLGFWAMANAVEKVLKTIPQIAKK